MEFLDLKRSRNWHVVELGTNAYAFSPLLSESVGWRSSADEPQGCPHQSGGRKRRSVPRELAAGPRSACASSYGCRHKWPQTWWLEMSEGRSLKSGSAGWNRGVGSAAFLVEGPGKTQPSGLFCSTFSAHGPSSALDHMGSCDILTGSGDWHVGIFGVPLIGWKSEKSSWVRQEKCTLVW